MYRSSRGGGNPYASLVISKIICKSAETLARRIARDDQFGIEHPRLILGFSFTLHTLVFAFPLCTLYNRLIRFPMPSGDAQEWIIQYSISCPPGYTRTYRDLAIRRDRELCRFAVIFHRFFPPLSLPLPAASVIDIHAWEITQGSKTLTTHR